MSFPMLCFQYFHPACVLKFLRYDLFFFFFNLEELNSNRLRSVHVSGWCKLSWNTENCFDKRLSTEITEGLKLKGSSGGHQGHLLLAVQDHIPV